MKTGSAYGQANQAEDQDVQYGRQIIGVRDSISERAIKYEGTKQAGLKITIVLSRSMVRQEAWSVTRVAYGLVTVCIAHLHGTNQLLQ